MNVVAAASAVQRVPSLSGTTSTDELSDHMSTDEPIEILGELVGATDLIAEDDDVVGAAKPYCEVMIGDRTVHKTGRAESMSPIWTLDTNSLFLLATTGDELTTQPLTIKLWTTRTVGPLAEVKTFLGKVHLDHAELIKRCDGERFELSVQDELGDDSFCRGTVALRLRLATPADSKFTKLWNTSRLTEKKILKALLDKEDNCPKRKLAVNVTETNESQVAGASFINALNFAFTTSSYKDTKSGTVKRLIKPHPDPKRMKATKYLSPHEITVETRRPSENWVEAGSGKLGKLHVEVLSCHGLPNVDLGEAVGNVTDSFVSLVFEDAFVQTPVIDDELSPHWLPWTQRAFTLGIMHPASMLYLGVFDYDLGPLLEHEPIGRVAVNMANLQRDTQYTLRYDLFKSSNVDDRTAHGQITIRLRVEMFDEKAALMTALKPRPNIHINVKKKKSFKVVRYTCFGEYDGENKFDLAVTRSYISEIFEYKRHLSYTISDSMKSLIFWRGQVEIFSILLPLHSFIFFVVASTLVERPYMFPAFAILSVAWIMIANGRNRRQHPSPWGKVPTFFHYLHILLRGDSQLAIKRINANQGREEGEAYEKAYLKREQDDYKKAEKRAELQRELDTVGDEAIHTEVQQMGIPLDLLVRLGRYQGYIGIVCRFFRKVRVVLLWEDSISSFWITAYFLGAGIVSLILPWSFILTWVGRIVVYGLFGPQMKIVDLYLRANKSNDLDKLMEAFDQKKKVARLRREQALKVKAIKCLRFGKYITQVPAYNLARHFDRPLASSTAKLMRKTPKVDFGSYLPGQQLYGEMIPRLEDGYHNNQSIALQRMQRLSVLETRMVVIRAAAKLGGGVKRRRQLLLKAQTEEELPEESGYELIDRAGRSLSQLLVPTEVEWMTPPLKGFDVKQPALPSLAGMSLCVVPYHESESNSFEEEKKDFDDVVSPQSTFDEGTEVLSPQTTYDERTDDISLYSTYDDVTRSYSQQSTFDDMSNIYSQAISPDGVRNGERPSTVDMLLTQDKGVHRSDVLLKRTEKEGEDEVSRGDEVSNGDYVAEEGIEIVAWSRFTEKEHGEGIEVETDVMSGETAGSLSVVYRASDSTFVAFYRP